MVTAFFSFLNLSYCAHRDASPPGEIGLLHWGATVYRCASWEVGTFNVLQKVVYRHIVVFNQLNSCIDKFVKVVRWNICRHTHRNTNLPVQKQVWYLSRKHYRLLLGTVVVIAEVNRFFVNVSKHLV